MTQQTDLNQGGHTRQPGQAAHAQPSRLFDQEVPGPGLNLKTVTSS